MRLPALFASDRRAMFARLLANGVAQGLLAVVSAVLVMRVFDRLGGGDAHAPVVFVALALVIVSSALLRRHERVDAERLGQHYVKAVRQRLFSRLLAASPRVLDKQRKGVLLLKFVGDLSALRRWITLGLSRLLVAGIAVAIAITALAWLYWPFAAVVTLLLLAAATWILRRGETLRRAIADTRRRQARLSANVTEKLNNLATVQAFGQSRRERRMLARQSDHLLRASVNKAYRIGSLRAVIDATAGACVLSVLAVAYWMPGHYPSPGIVVAAITIIGFLTAPLRDLGRAQEYWLAARVARDNLGAVSERLPKLRARRGAKPLVVSDGHIAFDRVSVRGVLRRATAEAPAGTRIAILGANGSGKSTLLCLLGRLLDPRRGRVLIDGQDIAKVRLQSLRRHVAYVSADVPLMRGSVRENLCYGANKVSADRLADVIDACRLGPLLERLPGGLDSRVAEAGKNLSQGERVLIGLARALLSRPRVLLLDEADAALDSAAVIMLGQVIRGFDGTVLMATHRTELLRECDHAWMLRDGRIDSGDNVDEMLPGAARVVPLRSAAPPGDDGLVAAR